jgi:hypothetical protein
MMEDGTASCKITGTVGAAVRGGKPRILLTGPPGTRQIHFAFLLMELFHFFFFCFM